MVVYLELLIKFVLYMHHPVTARIISLADDTPLFKATLTEFLSSVVPYLEEQNAGEEEYARLERLTVPESWRSRWG